MPAEVRVKISADGVAEIVQALRTTRLEGEKAGAPLPGVVRSLISMRTILGPLSAAVAGFSFVGFIQSAVQATQSLLNAKEVISDTVANTRGLDLAAQHAGTSIGAISGKVAQLAKSSTAALRGDPESLGLFRAIGLTRKEIENFANQGTVQRVETIGKALNRLKDGPEKASAEAALLKRGLQDLLPVLVEVGQHGLPKLGFTASESAIRVANELGNAWTDMITQVRELAIQFVSGLAPSTIGSLEAISAELARNADSWKDWGDFVGKIVVAATSLIVTSMDTIQTQTKNAGILIAANLRAVALHGAGRSLEAISEISTAQAEVEANNKLADERRQRFLDDLARKVTATAPLSRIGTTDDRDLFPGSAAPNEDAARRQRELVRAESDRDLTIFKAGLKLRSEAEEQSFSAGLINIREYFARQREIIIEGINAEVTALQQRRVAVIHDPDVKNVPAELAKIDGQIGVLTKSRTEQLLASDRKESDAIRQFGQERLNIDQKIFEARGLQHQAALLGIQEEIDKTAQLLAHGDIAAEEAQQILDDLRAARTFQADFDAAALDFNRTLQGLERDRSGIQDKVSAGLTSQLVAQAKIYQLEKDRLDNLKLLAAALNRVAQESGDPALLDKAAQVSQSVVQIEDSIKSVEDVNLGAKSTAIDAFGDSLVKNFGDGELSVIKWGSTTKAVLLDVLGALRAFLTRWLVLRAITAIFPSKSGTPYLDAGTTLGDPVTAGRIPQSPRTAGALGSALPSTGAVSAPALSPAQVSTLANLNQYEWQPVPSSRFTQPRLPSVSPSNGDNARTQITVGLDDGLVVRAIEQYLDSPRGSKVFVRAAAKNRVAMRAGLSL